MSHPYIIWTMQRTGGTTLAALFADLSEHPRVQHEPFNRERAYGHILADWTGHGDFAKLREAIATALQPRPVIKHCHELVPAPLNEALMAVAGQLGYRHVVLQRRAEVDRILSLELAKTNDVWGKVEANRLYQKLVAGSAEARPLNISRALAHMQMCQARQDALEALFAAAGETPYRVVFEDVYTDLEAGRAIIHELVRFLEIDLRRHSDHSRRIHEALLQKGQNSSGIAAFVPNYDEARAALTAAYRQQAMTG